MWQRASHIWLTPGSAKSCAGTAIVYVLLEVNYWSLILGFPNTEVILFHICFNIYFATFFVRRFWPRSLALYVVCTYLCRAISSGVLNENLVNNEILNVQHNWFCYPTYSNSPCISCSTKHSETLSFIGFGGMDSFYRIPR